MADQHLIYHWKHGWIPLTHAAALSKAHGNPKLADKYVAGSSEHHAGHLQTSGMSARSIHGTLAPHRHSDPTSLNVGDHATVRGMDQFGQPMTFTGHVAGKSQVRIKKGPSGKVEMHTALSMHNGSKHGGGMDATARTTVYVKNPEQSAESPKSAPRSAGEHFSMSGAELKSRAAKGDAGAQAEMDRRASRKAEKRGTPVPKPSAPTAKHPSMPSRRPKNAEPKPPETKLDPNAVALAKWNKENRVIEGLLPGHTLQSRVVDVQNGQPRGIHVQHAANGDRVGSVFESRDGSFQATLNGQSVGKYSTRTEAHTVLAQRHVQAASAERAKADKAAADNARVSAKAVAGKTGGFQPDPFASDGTRAGDAAAAKVKQSFKLGNHRVLIETALNREQTSGLLGDIHSVLLKSGQMDAAKGVTFHVPSGDKKFRETRRGTVGGYVRVGQDTVFINPKVANGSITDRFGGMDASDSFMAAAKQTSGRQYVVTHELGHVLDHQNSHTHETSYLGSHQVRYDSTRPDVQAFAASQRTDLSTYGRTSVAEGYAEAFAQWVHGGPGSSPAADAYAAKFGWAVPKQFIYGRPRV